MPLKRTVAPSLVALDLDDVKSHLRITIDTDDALLNSYIDAATVRLEDLTDTALLTQTWEQKLNRFQDEMLLYRPPLQSVTSIKYYDNNNVEQTLSTSIYDVDTYSTPGRITLAYEQEWPTITDIVNGITITYVAGYEHPDLIPRSLRQALLLDVGHFENNRTATDTMTIKEIPLGYSALISPYRMMW